MMMRRAATTAAFLIGAQLAAARSAGPVISLLPGSTGAAGSASDGATAGSGSNAASSNGPNGQILDRSASVAFTIVRDETAFATWSAAPAVIATPGPGARASGGSGGLAGNPGESTGSAGSTQTGSGESYLAIAT